MLTWWLVSDSALGHKLDGEDFYTQQLENAACVAQRLAGMNDRLTLQSSSHTPVVMGFHRGSQGAFRIHDPT